MRDEYEYLKKGMEIMEQYFNVDALSNVETDELNDGSTSTCRRPSIFDEAINEADADITVLRQSDLAEKESDAVLSVLKDGKNETEVVVMPSGGVEGSLHKHISALAARIQSELGIKVQLVGEVDPSEILGANIHSQDGIRSTTPKHKDTSSPVDHLFQSVRPEGTSRKLNLADLQDAEDIISRAIPSPRDTSRDSSPVSPRQSGESHENKDIGSLNSAELRRKRLGMFVDSYTKPRESSPEGRANSPNVRSTSPGRTRSSPTSHQDDMNDNQLVEPSTEHQMKTYKESRHQIQTESPRSPRETARSQATALKPEPMRKKFTTANTPLLPSKFNLTSVGVAKNGPTPDSEVGSGNSGPPWAVSARWKPFSRLAKAARLKQEPRPPAKSLSKSDMEVEAALIQDDVFLRYGGEDDATRDNEQELKDSRYAQQNDVSLKSRGKKENDNIQQTNNDEYKAKNVSAKKEYSQSNKTTKRSTKSTDIPTKDYSVKSSSWSEVGPSSVTPITETEKTGSVFKDFDYTDYLLSKYGGESESSDVIPSFVHHSDFRSSSAVSSLPSPSPDIVEDSSSSDSEPELTKPDIRPVPRYSVQYEKHSQSRFDKVPNFKPSASTSGKKSSPLSPSPSLPIKPKPIKRSDAGYTPRPIKECISRLTQDSAPKISTKHKSDRGSSRSSKRSSSRPEMNKVKQTPSNDTNKLYGSETSSLSSVRLHSSPPLRSDYTSVAPPRSSVTPQPWHSSRSSSFSPYKSDTLDTSRSETRTFYSEFFNKGDSDDKYWKEPKQYDYRHENASSPWREPRRREAWADVDRHWSETSIAGSSKSRLYNGASSSLSASSGRSTPYQSLTDQWTFSSSVVPEADARGRQSYLDGRGSASIYGLGRNSYDGTGKDMQSSSRTFLTK